MKYEAYLNDPSLKEQMLLRIAGHARLDEIAQGEYWQNGKGCAITCMAYSHDDFSNNLPGGIQDLHEKLESEWGIYSPLAQVADAIFEGLPRIKAKVWPQQFCKWMDVGTHTQRLYHRLWASIIEDTEHGLRRVVAERDHDGIKHLAYIHHRMAFGYKPSQQVMTGIWSYQKRATGPIGAMAFEAAANSIWAALYRDGQYSLDVTTHMRPAWQATNHASIAIGMANCPAKNWNYTRATIVPRERIDLYFNWLAGHLLRFMGSTELYEDWTEEEVENIPI